MLAAASDLPDAQDGAGKPKGHQSRELPRIPPNSAVDTLASAGSMDGDQGAGAEGPYEVLKDSSSQENMVEDCLYETVKEVKEAAVPPGKGPGGRSRVGPAPKEPPAPQAPGRADLAEYASVDRNKKCRQSVTADSVLGPARGAEEEAPPPVPVKLLDENENLQAQDRRASEGTRETSKVSACDHRSWGLGSSWPCSGRHIHIHTHATHMCMHTCTHAHTHVYTHTRARTHTRAHAHVHTYTCPHMCAHVHIYLHTCAHTYTYTHIHTCTVLVEVVSDLFPPSSGTLHTQASRTALSWHLA